MFVDWNLRSWFYSIKEPMALLIKALMEIIVHP